MCILLCKITLVTLWRMGWRGTNWRQKVQLGRTMKAAAGGKVENND